MKTIFLFIILAALADAQVLRFDFRESHDLGKAVDDMAQLQLLEDKGKHGKEYFASNVQVEVLIERRSGHHRELGTFRYQCIGGAGIISTFRMQGPPYARWDEAYKAGKILYSAFSIPHERLEEWRPNAGSGRDVKNVMDGNGRGYYPSVNIDIRPSMSESIL